MAEVSKVAVIGLGTMGAGIAEVFAARGHEVCGIEYNDEALARGQKILEKSVGRAVEKGKLAADERDALLSRLTWSTDKADVADCGLIIEAVNENLELKRAIFAEVDTHAAPDAVLATNTSSLSITEIATAIAEPARLIGVHFFNPAPVQKLVEVIRTLSTSEAAVEATVELLRGIGKTPIVCRDRAGFVVNRLLLGFMNEAIALYEQGIATREDLDAAFVERAGNPMGPLTLADLVGVDVHLAVCERLHDETKDPLFAPTPLVRQMVTSGLLGRKTGRGFYGYGDQEGAPALVPAPRAPRPGDLPDRIVAPYLNNALRMVEVGYATCDDIDTGMALGCRLPKPFDVIAARGPADLLAAQRAIAEETGQASHQPTRLLVELAGAEDPVAALERLRRG